VIAVIAGISLFAVRCCGMGPVLAALGDNKNKAPAGPTRSSTPTAPTTSIPANVAPVATATATATTSPVVRPVRSCAGCVVQ
jgi:hypothetical protein